MSRPTPAVPRITGPRDTARLGPLDPREAAWRDDLADIALSGSVAVPAYASPILKCVGVERAALHASPNGIAVSELLFGEEFAVLEISGGWAWGYGCHDHYVGYVRAEALAGHFQATHMVGPGDALLFSDASIKSAIAGRLPMGARLEAFEHDKYFMRLLDGRFIHRRHVLPPTGHPQGDAVTFAYAFLGAPYQWGGRSRAGVDCSGVVQVALALAGIKARRDSDMQFNDLGMPEQQPRRGCLAYWPGHIGLMVDSGNLLHANAHWMSTVVEPLADVVARAATRGDAQTMPLFRQL